MPRRIDTWSYRLPAGIAGRLPGFAGIAIDPQAWQPLRCLGEVRQAPMMPAGNTK
jgi:hypothetical protein